MISDGDDIKLIITLDSTVSGRLKEKIGGHKGHSILHQD